MAIHTKLPVYKLASDLLDLSAGLLRNYPKPFRPMGQAIADACLRMLILIARANAARNKLPAIEEMLEHLHVAEILLRLSMDKKIITPNQYARAAGVCVRIGNQAGGWRRSQLSTSVS